jgi:hypothetical protein
MMGRVILCLAFISILASCGGEEDLTGVWRTDSGVTVSWPEGGEFSGRIELVFGQYGSSVAGIMRLYQAGEEFKDNYLYSSCPCTYMEQASFDGEVLVFDVKACVMNDGEQHPFVSSEWFGRFYYIDEGGGQLSGRLEAADRAAGDIVGRSQLFSLSKTGDEKTIRMEELNLGCEGL